MYAVIKTGGKQYRVAPGDVIEVEHLSSKGGETTFTPVLVVTDEGKTVYGANDLKAFPVAAKVLGDAKGDKVTVFKYRPKSGYSSKTGHRQLYSLIEITSIGGKGESKSPAPKEAKTQAPKEAKTQAPKEAEAPAPEEANETKPEGEEPVAAESPDASGQA